MRAAGSRADRRLMMPPKNRVPIAANAPNGACLRINNLCRNITRPALADERVQCNAAGQVMLKLNTPWHDGTRPQVMSPLELIQLAVGWPLCGGQIYWFSVSSGSGPGAEPYAPNGCCTYPHRT